VPCGPLLVKDANGDPIGDALHQAAVGEHPVAGDGISAFLVVTQQPAAPVRFNRDTVGVGADR
jgi:hypothetical protein